MKFDNETGLVKKLNDYLAKEYQGYVQFSGCAIDNDCIFDGKSHTIPTNKEGFIYEAHLSDSQTTSITVRRINKEWYMDVTDISNHLKEIQLYKGQHNKTIKMVQIWEEKADELCEGMKVKKLQKVVFAGFEESKGEQS